MSLETDDQDSEEYGSQQVEARDMEMALETIANVFYLIEVDASDEERVRSYAKLAQRPLQTIWKLSAAIISAHS